MIISALKLLESPVEELWEDLVGEFTLQFPDGTLINTNAILTIISRYAWELNKKYPEIGLKPEHHVSHYMSDDITFKPSTMASLLSHLKNEIFDLYPFNYPMQDDVWRTMYSTSNDFVNGMEWHRAAYQISGSCHDALDIMFNTEIMDIDKNNPVNIDTMRSNPDLIQSIYRRKQEVLKQPNFKLNNLVIMTSSSVGKMSQLMQAIGPRGMIENMNSHIYPWPISTGYMMGLFKAHDISIESRTAAMSLNNQSGPLKFTEYLSRRVQFIGMQVQNLHHGDCGSTYHLTFQVRDKQPGKVQGDLELLEGMNYLDTEDPSGVPKYKAIKKTDKHLIGKRLKVRTVLGCQHKDPNGICSTCLGVTSRNVAQFRNIGHYAMVVLTAIISQMVLSTKHETSSSTASLINLLDSDKLYYEEMNDSLAVGFKSDFFKHYKKPKLLINARDIHALRDIEEIENVTELSPQRTSSVKTLRLSLEDKFDEKQIITSNLVSYHDEGYFSSAFLKYIKENGYSINRSGDIVVDMENWDVMNAIIQIIPKQFSTFEYGKGFERLIKSSMDEITYRATEMTPESYLMELTDTINMKLSVNISVLQLVAFSMLCTDIENKDYSTPKPHTKHGVGTLTHIIKGRSLGSSLSHEDHADIMQSPASFFYTNRQDHCMDEMFVPEQMDLKYREVLDLPRKIKR